MNDTLSKITAWIKENILMSVLIFSVVLFVFFGKQLKKIFIAPKRKRRRPGSPASKKSNTGRARAAKPRKTGSSSKGYAAAGGGTIPFKYNKDGSIKKAWQVAGTVAAKQRMARLRRNR